MIGFGFRNEIGSGIWRDLGVLGCNVFYGCFLVSSCFLMNL